MATNAQWKTAPPSSPFGGTLGVIALALGIGVAAAFVLDAHGHRCEACGHKWWHLGAFNLGDEDAHRCKCGVVQWWKNGVPQVIRDAHRAQPMRQLAGQVWRTG
jgi:hypothetical protein